MTDISKVREVFLHEYAATGRNLDAALAAVVTAALAHDPRPRHWVRDDVSAEAIAHVLARVAEHYRLPVERLTDRQLGGRRQAFPRYVAATLLRELGMSMARIAHAIGLKDHTTVLYGLRLVGKRPDLRRAVQLVRAHPRFAVDGQAAASTAEPAADPPAAKTPRRSRAVSTLSAEETA